MIATLNPMRSDTRAPITTRAKMSRPSLSVPNTCDREGPLRDAAMSGALASGSGSSGASSASNTIDEPAQAPERKGRQAQSEPRSDLRRAGRSVVWGKDTGHGLILQGS
jgi:hypothetical protein